MGRNPYNFSSGRRYFKYPEYTHKNLQTRKSLLASVNGRKAGFNNILASKAIKAEEKAIVQEILDKLDLLAETIKDNGHGKIKMEKSIIRIKGTGSSI